MAFEDYMIPAVLCGGILVVGLIADFFSEKEIAATKYAEGLVQAERTDKIKDIFTEFPDAKAKSDAIIAREKAEATKLIDQWKESSGYSARMAQISTSKKVEDEVVRTNFGFDSKKADILSRAEREIEQIKTNMGYDSKISELKGKISEAESSYKLQKGTMKMACGDDQNTYEQLKKTAKRVKDEAVSNAKVSISNLEKRFEEQSKLVIERRDKDISRLQADFDKELSTINGHYSKDITELNGDLSNNIKRINAQIVENRSAEDCAAIKNAQEMDIRYSEAIKEEHGKESKILAAMTSKDKLAALLVEKGLSKTSVILLSCIPFIPIVVLVIKYVGDIRYVLSAMDRAKEVMT